MPSIAVWQAKSPVVKVPSERDSTSAKVPANENQMGMVDSSSAALVPHQRGKQARGEGSSQGLNF